MPPRHVRLAVSLLLLATAVVHASAVTSVSFTDKVVATSKTTTTLQVVVNPLLGEESPVNRQCWQSLQDLGADLVRFVPWFPYPRVGVAELEPATATATHWNFTLIDYSLTAFMNATYEQGHSTIINFSTQPDWLYVNASTAALPADPWTTVSYPSGNGLRDPSGKELGDYYGRLLSWLTRGWFVDELGTNHTNGHTYDLTHWEVYNEPEGCHGLNASEYTRQYDIVVAAILDAVPPAVAAKMQFVGLALTSPNLDWMSTFLNTSNHAPGIPVDYVSFHHYCRPSSRTDPKTYEVFFSQVDTFMEDVQDVVALRDAMRPNVKLDIDEIGVILPDDNTAGAPLPPARYWPAAGAMYAYFFARAAALGVDVVGESQLAGIPSLPQYGFPDPQYPSVSLLDWNTGAGNARYWVLKLLLDHFAPGDALLHTETSTTPLCASTGTSIANLTLTCADAGAVMTGIDFASYGTPTGSCGHFAVNASCDAGPKVAATIKADCVGQHSCTVLSYPTWGDPCEGVVKQLVVQATCSTGGGLGSAAVFAQAFRTPTGSTSLLLINKLNTPSAVSLPVSSGTLYTVDENTGDGAPRKTVLSSSAATLAPFATAVLVLGG